MILFENKKQTDDHVVLLSTGDMWQGSAESVLSNGKIIIDWMNELGFEAMTLGNHEFDWGEQVIKDNALVADFPFLAINIYDNNTGALAEYCRPSVVFDRGDIQIAIIGAIGITIFTILIKKKNLNSEEVIEFNNINGLN